MQQLISHPAMVGKAVAVRICRSGIATIAAHSVANAGFGCGARVHTQQSDAGFQSITCPCGVARPSSAASSSDESHASRGASSSRAQAATACAH